MKTLTLTLKGEHSHVTFSCSFDANWEPAVRCILVAFGIDGYEPDFKWLRDGNEFYCTLSYVIHVK